MQRQRHRPEKRLDGKTCIVTGASRGIGAAIATELGEAGADVAVNYRSSDRKARTTAEAAAGDENETTTVQADVSDRAAVERMATEVRSELGAVDVVVNNAGVTADGRFEDVSEEKWRHVMDVNLDGAYNVTRAFYEDIKQSEEGRLVNVSSVVGEQGNFGQANYAASKGGMLAFTKSLALELADSGATANCVTPGFTQTDMFESVDDRIQENIRERIPMGRFGEPEEVAAVVAFLAGDDASYVSGQAIGVNGALRR